MGDPLRKAIRRPGRLLIMMIVATCSSGDGARVSTAHREAIVTSAKDLVADLRAKAEMLGSTRLGEPYERSIAPFLNDVAAAVADLQHAAAGVDTNESSGNVFVLAGVSLGGYGAAGMSRGIPPSDELDPSSKLVTDLVEEKERSLDGSELADELHRPLTFLAEIVVLGENGLTDQLVPPDSPLRTDWDRNSDGQIEVPPPPLPRADADAWDDFTRAIEHERRRGSPTGRVLLEISSWAQKFEPE
jgi:hypothetical protein